MNSFINLVRRVLFVYSQCVMNNNYTRSHQFREIEKNWRENKKNATITKKHSPLGPAPAPPFTYQLFKAERTQQSATPTTSRFQGLGMLTREFPKATHKLASAPTAGPYAYVG